MPPQTPARARRVMHSITFKPEDSDFLTRMNLANHRVALATLPWVALVLLVRALLEVFLGFEGIFSAETVTPFTTASMFVIAIILGGVLEDYKEAERIPAEMAGALDSLSEKLQFMELATSRAAARQERLREEGGGAVGGEEPVVVASSAEEHGELLAYITALIEYFAGMRGDQDILGVTSMFSRYFALKVNESSEWTHTESWEVFEAFDELRASIHRMSVIKNTDFIPSGRSLMQVLVWATVILVALARYDNSAPEVPAGGGGRRLWGSGEAGGGSDAEEWLTSNVSAYCNVSTYCFLFIYVLKLIGDLEDPFDYTVYALVPKLAPPSGSSDLEKKMLRPHANGGCCVDMFPFLELFTRVASLAERHDITGEPPSGRGSLPGIRCSYLMAREPEDARRPLVPPSAVLRAAERNERVVDARTLDRREEFRELLYDTVHTALHAVRRVHASASPEGSPEGSPGRRAGAQPQGGAATGLSIKLLSVND